MSNPFSDEFVGAHVVINRLICQPTPDNCERVVVLSPTTIGQVELIRRVEAHLKTALGWRTTSYKAVVEPDEGDAFDGPTSRHGGYVNAAASQLRYWASSGWAKEAPPDRDEQAVLTATRSTTGGVVVTIM